MCLLSPSLSLSSLLSTFLVCFFAPLTKPNKVWCSNLLCSLQLRRFGTAFFVFARALTFFIIFLSCSTIFASSAFFFCSFSGFAFFNSIYFWIYTYLCTWDSFPLTVSNFYAPRPENSFYIFAFLVFFFCHICWRVLMKIDAAKVRKGYWRV